MQSKFAMSLLMGSMLFGNPVAAATVQYDCTALYSARMSLSIAMGENDSWRTDEAKAQAEWERDFCVNHYSGLDDESEQMRRNCEGDYQEKIQQIESERAKREAHIAMLTWAVESLEAEALLAGYTC